MSPVFYVFWGAAQICTFANVPSHGEQDEFGRNTGCFTSYFWGMKMIEVGNLPWKNSFSATPELEMQSHQSPPWVPSAYSKSCNFFGPLSIRTGAKLHVTKQMLLLCKKGNRSTTAMLTPSNSPLQYFLSALFVPMGLQNHWWWRKLPWQDTWREKLGWCLNG